MRRISLDGAWTGKRTSNGNTFPATVPGCVHTDLMRAGELPSDIYWRDNAEQAQWIEKEDWTYTKCFEIDRMESGATLVFECLDTYCEIYLNHQYVGTTDNMFITHKFPVDDKLVQGENELVMMFHSPIERTKGCFPRYAAFSQGRIYTRRMQCTYGWDWTMRFVTCGIEKSCYIEFENQPCATAVYVYTESMDAFGAQIVCDTEFKHYEMGLTYDIVVLDPDGNEVYHNTRYCEEASHREYISIEKPKLWNPVGYGEQWMYTLRVCVGEEVLVQPFGIRTVRILQQENKVGTESYNLCLALKDTESGKEWDFNDKFSSFTPIVNGRRIFCKGANWAPCEPFVSEVSKEKITRILELSAAAGLNMLRIWGGGMFESTHFYNECDRLGIMVNQDFLMACGHYPEDEEWFVEALQKEAEYAARSLRNHPSLVWWNGDNENAVGGNECMVTYPGRTSAVKAIAPVLKALDPMRRFLPSSPYGGDRYASKTAGTTHNTQFLGTFLRYLERGELTTYKEDYKEFLARFIAEEPSMGAVSSLSLKRFMSEADIYEGDEMWNYHTQSNPALRTSLYEYETMFAENLLGAFTDGADRLFKLQYIQYEWIRLSFEMARRNMWFSSGLLFWMLADCWPAASGWAIIDYYCLPKASYYSFKRCAKGIVGSIDKDLYISNDTLGKADVQVIVNVVNYKTNERKKCGVYNVAVDAQSVARLPLQITLAEGEIVVCDMLSGKMRDRTTYKEGKLEMKQMNLVHVVTQTEDTITLEANGYVHAVGMEGECIFEDNYFTMLPGEQVTIPYRRIACNEDERITVTGYGIILS